MTQDRPEMSGDAGSSLAEGATSHDPEVAESYAEAVGTDPTPEQIDTYLALEGEPPLSDQMDQARGSDAADGEELEAGSPT
jgi:hypothetical protein